MISSFFSKAKPIHLIIVCLIILVVFLPSKLYALQEPFSFGLLMRQTALFLIVVATVFLLDFFASRNNLTKKNSYKILIFSLFIALLPATILNSKILIANLFILFALRRLISLRSNKEIKKKLFDAAFWISIATLLYFWAILFFVLVILGIILYRVIDIKNWIIPFVGILTVVIIGVSTMVLTGYDFINYFENQINLSFDFSTLNSKRIIVACTVILSYGIWSLLYFIRYLKAKSKKSRPSFVLIIFTILVALLIVAVSPNKNGSEFLFLFGPLSIIITNYLETISEKWFKETLLAGLLATPLILLLL